jgi:hypothetical protein
VTSTKLAPTAGSNFDGLTDSSPNPCNCAPPDNEVAAGATQVVEIVNSELAVYSKTGGTQIKAESTNTIWSGFSGLCSSDNDGDATVTYDTLAQRWVIQQFAVSHVNRKNPYQECIAISTTSDATGSYFRYSFSYSSFPDYPKLGVWSDAYYASFNRFSGNTFLGAEMCAFNRAKMLTGAAATQQCFTPSAAQGSVLPATIDGPTAPPANEAEWFVGISPSTANALAYWKFHVDWTTPANTTLTGPTSLGVNSFSEACGGDATCIPQPGTTQQLDSLGDRLMWRLAYRNFGDHEAMVVAHSVTAGSSVGTRWYELRPSSGSLTVNQQGTYAPDATYRWMGSIAMDQAGNMALGYSTSSSSLDPGVAFTGRVPSDPAGTMSQGETTLLAGGGSQTGGLSRWGDYSEMSVDPVDDCSFWYVNEYLPSDGSFNWSTRIGSFKLPGCGTNSGSAPTVTTGSPSPVGSTTATISGTVNPNGQSTTYQFDYGTSTSYGSHSPTSPGSAGSGTTAVVESANLTGLSSGTTYHYRIEATNATGTSLGSDQSFATIPPAPTGLSATAGAGQVSLSWNSSLGATGYKVFRGTSPGGESSSAIANPSGTSYTDTNVTAGTTYYYTVKATNSAGDSPTSNEASATPTAAASYASTVLATPGLVSYWRMDETSGTTAHDQKSVNPGTYTGAYTLNQPGALVGDSDAAASFDGASGLVTVPDNASLQFGTGDFSVEAWVKTTASGAGDHPIISNNSASYEYTLYLNGGVPRFRVYPAVVSGSTSIADGKWHYLVGVRSAGVAYLYVDGTLASSGPATNIASPNGNLCIGGDSFNGVYLAATIDEAAVYNTALSAGTIQNHYNSGTGI